jgi:hypothetical protein
VAESVVLLTCPLGPIPLAARGLAAVLARAGLAGAVVDELPAAADGEDPLRPLRKLTHVPGWWLESVTSRTRAPVSSQSS